MNHKRALFRKSVAWLLITTLINPAMVAPAFARDSDIYLNATTGTSAAEPNVLFVLGTNDRMNVAEAWREYDPNVYDSHAEYLWNDLAIIKTGLFGSPETKTESPSSISTDVPPINPSSPWGTWSGALTPDRQALWRATAAYARGTQPGDPGARSAYRNYWDGSWLYWLPAGSNIAADPRMWSTSFNRFRAHIGTVTGVRGGVTFPAANAPYDAASGSTVDYRAFNMCSGSINQIAPSTVFAPTAAPPNNGYYLNQQWVRYEPYLNLTAVNSPGTNYPGNNTTVNGATNNTSTAPTQTTFVRGYVDGVSGAPTNTAVTPPTNVYRDDWNNPASNNRNGAQGQPIRIQGAGYGAWTDPKADLGGFVFQSHVANSSSYYYPEGVLTTLRTTAYGGTYSLPAFSGSTTLSQEQFAAWRGNRDGAPTFGNVVGTSAYYDVTVASCDPVNGAPGAVANQCIAYGTSVGTITRQCTTGTPFKQERDASTAVRYSEGTCVSTGATCTIAGNPPTSDLTACLNAGIQDPSCSPPTQDTFFNKYYEANCGVSGGTTLTIAQCQWSGRQSVFVEGQGTYFYGGSCTESGSPLSCNAGGTTLTLNGNSQSNVVGPYPAPVPANAGTFDGCTNKATASIGSYNNGGTCGGGTEYQVIPPKNAISGAPPAPGARTPVLPAECTAGGPGSGTSISIRGGPMLSYNETCTNTPPVNPQTCGWWYGAACPVTNVCPASVSMSGGPASYYQAYMQKANQPNLYHECLADGPAQNPGGNSYPTKYARRFADPIDTTVRANTNPASGGNVTASYTRNAAQAYAADASKNIDVYSVNYLNFKLGAKACRDAAGALITAGPLGAPPAGATCSPIARKTRLQIAKDALSGLVASTDGVRLGLMVFNKTGTDTSSEGANVAYAIRRMGSNAFGATADELTAYNNRADLIKVIQGVVASSRTPLTETLYEAYLYFSGRSPKWGTSNSPAQGGGAISAGRETSAGANTDSPSVAGNVYLTSGGIYNSPMLNNPTVAKPANCQKNYIVMITNGQPEEDFSANDDIKKISWPSPTGDTVSPRTDLDSHGAKPSNAGPPDYRQIPTVLGGSPFGPTDQIGTANDGGFAWLDELTYFMANADVSPGAPNFPSELATDDKITGRQSVVTYTIGFAGVNAPVVQNAAVAAQGVYYVAQNAQQLQSALVSAFIAIRDWSPTAAAATVPISSLNRGESSTDVYLAFFGPQPQSTWPGTVKKYQLSTNPAACGTGVPLCLVGQSGKNIEVTDPVTNQTSVDATAASGVNSDAPPWTLPSLQDGAKPDKGGTGQVLINTLTPDTRKIYTYLSGAVSSLADLSAASNRMHFNNAAITKTLLGNAAMTDAERESLINYIRGGNLGDVNCSDGSGGTPCTTWSTWPHSATEHTKPTVVTYDNKAAVPVQYVYYLQNNGMLTAADSRTGLEKWSFLIEEALPQLSALRANNNGPEIYVADGNPEVYVLDRNANGVIEPADGDRVWLYFGLRRGGRSIYAIDVTSKDAPLFKWKITANGGTGKVCVGTAACTSVPAFDELGQTWSTPLVAHIRKLDASGDPALIFGGGYDPAEDTVPPGTRTMGRAVYVINGNTADLIKAWGTGSGKSGIDVGAGMTYAVPSDVTAISTDLDPLIDRVYVGDMGGNVWRFDIDDKDEGAWRGMQLATLSNPSGEKRKFFYPPAVAPQSLPGSADVFDAVYIGSGDKEHPTLASTTTPATTDDRIFMLIDEHNLKSTGKGLPITLSTLLDIAQDTTKVDAASLGGVQGWMRRLDNGEKVVNSPTVFFGRLRFGTFAPLTSVNDCTPPGEGRLNEIDSLSGSTVALNATTSGANPRYYSTFLSRGYMSSTQLLVLPTGASGKTKSVFTFACADAQCLGQNVLTLGAPTKVYWYMEPEQ